LRDTYHSIFDKYGVDLVLEGHVHDYQRSFPVKYNPSNPPKPVVTSSKKNDYVNPTGEIYALVGTGGINLHGLSGKSSFISSQQDSKFGVLDIKITNGGSKLVAKYYTNSGSIKDQFSITKLNSGSNSNPFASGTSSLDNPFSPS
jgi:3',5'-cyclic AMP phosphodiesterase CpdA